LRRHAQRRGCRNMPALARLIAKWAKPLLTSPHSLALERN
jgi:hypothetical protein